ncbi:MAG: hypothetical protein LBE65_01375, partial [Synergistaceae bacterium]|nr:hypothetical protein [Synergistaceae bacterium]
EQRARRAVPFFVRGCPAFSPCLIGYADTAGFADSDWLVSKITDLTDLLEFVGLAKLLEFYGALLSLIPQS